MSSMLTSIFSALLVVSQLTGPGGALPQILTPDFRATTPLKAGKRGEVTVAFKVRNGYAIDRTLPLTLKLTSIGGVSVPGEDIAASGKDPKAKDQYYVDLPTLKVPITAAKAGKYEVPGKLKYFFCNKADGFCSYQIVDVKIPLNVD
jgi:hypothetical protein